MTFARARNATSNASVAGVSWPRQSAPMRITGHETDLTEGRWELIEPMLPAARKLGRKQTSLRRILDALLSIAKAGCRWRLLPVDLPPRQTVSAVFLKWIAEDLCKAGKRSRPTTAISDSQSGKAAISSLLHGWSLDSQTALSTGSSSAGS